MEGVGAKFEQAAELAGCGGGPEGEFLHQGGVLGRDEGLEMFVECREFWVGCDGVEGGVVALIALVLPDVDLISKVVSICSVLK